jgi:hypothetical protein
MHGNKSILYIGKLMLLGSKNGCVRIEYVTSEKARFLLFLSKLSSY